MGDFTDSPASSSRTHVSYAKPGDDEDLSASDLSTSKSFLKQHASNDDPEILGYAHPPIPRQASLSPQGKRREQLLSYVGWYNPTVQRVWKFIQGPRPKVDLPGACILIYLQHTVSPNVTNDTRNPTLQTRRPFWARPSASEDAPTPSASNPPSSAPPVSSNPNGYSSSSPQPTSSAWPSSRALRHGSPLPTRTSPVRPSGGRRTPGVGSTGGTVRRLAIRALRLGVRRGVARSRCIIRGRWAMRGLILCP